MYPSIQVFKFNKMSNYPLPITHNVKARDPVGSKKGNMRKKEVKIISSTVVVRGKS